MEKNTSVVHGRIKKRKTLEEAHSNPPFSFDELSQDLLEIVLSWLPASSFLRLRSVCKRWSSVSVSPTFKIACSQIPFRDPWFLMVDHELNQSVIFDTSEGNWKNLICPAGFNQVKRIAISSCDGLVCFRHTSGGFEVCNPVTGICRKLPLPDFAQPLHAVSMSFDKDSSFSSYRVVLVSGELPNLSFRMFSSDKNKWEEEVMLIRQAGDSSETDISGGETVYFLSKSGEVVATNMLRSPSKEFSSVLAIENGEEIVYFLSQSGTVIACNLNKRNFYEHPRLLPIYSEYSIDVVVCKGEMMVVVLSEFLETASLRVWRFSKGSKSWLQVAAMPPSMSHEFYGRKADINCAGCGDMIFVCLNSINFSSCVICNVVENVWKELPKCVVNGKAKEFVSAFSFEPRLEAIV
ncbi:F-box only protein 13-like [Dendrobium catenatum]|uniref:F-box only protein 13 n=1 Tax=Dendrobium catenatum TaxID=906689 RepID=A0A2I0WG88_9ASPA|nr:F-box only protein 13-like [Dendrobium catenatum]PKU74673.1 F-box only protein 13 [Dendrobium catenatum]